MRYLAFCFILFAGSACTPAPEAGKTPDTPKAYRTTQPSLLYFKNMRSSNYQQEEQKGSRITFYTHNRLSKQTKDSLGFTPRIASDWLNDRAFLIPAWTGSQLTPSAPLTVWYDGGDSLVLDSPTPMAQTDWLLRVHELMREGSLLYLQTGSADQHPFLRDERLRATFSTIVKDYQRLTERE